MLKEEYSTLRRMLWLLTPVFERSEDADQIVEFIEVGEYGLAYEYIVSVLQERKESAPDSAIDILNELADKMELERWSPEPPSAGPSDS